MVNTEYANAYSEVLEILKFISEDEFNKIPKEKIDFYEKNANKSYDFIYNPLQTLDEQNVSKVTKCIIAILFRDYWATPTQREKIIAKQKYDRIQIEKSKVEKYNPNSIFKNSNLNKEKTKKNETALIEIKNEKWYERVFSFLKKFLKGN